MHLPLLLADLDDILKGLGAILPVVFWVIFQVFAAIKEEKDQDKQPPPPEAEVLEGMNLDEMALDDAEIEAVEARAADQDPVRSEVDEFLRRIGGEPEPGGPATIQEDPKPVLDPLQEPPKRRRSKRRRKPKQTPPRIEVVVQDESTAQKEPLVKPPARLQEGRLADQSAHLGEQFAQADDRVEARIHEKFDHRLGKLSSRQAGDRSAEPTEPQPETPAATIKQMLSTPAGVRDAIILREILAPPSDRW